MTVSYPYPLAVLSDRLNVQTILWSIQRNDELSGLGSGQIIQAELAPPLWTGEVVLDMDYHDGAKQIAAIIRKLHGAQEAFFLCDPLSKYPQSDPDGALLGSSVVQVDVIPSHRASIALKGLPAGYNLLPGDKMQIAYGADPTRYAFLEISESATAFGDGTTGLIGVFPHIPVGIGINDIVTLAKAACRCVIVPGSHNPGTGNGMFTEGAGFKVIQKK